MSSHWNIVCFGILSVVYNNCRVLGSVFGIDDNFFDLGGRSIIAVRVVRKISEVLGIELKPKHLFMHPTVRELSAYLEAQGALAELAVNKLTLQEDEVEEF